MITSDRFINYKVQLAFPFLYFCACRTKTLVLEKLT